MSAGVTVLSVRANLVFFWRVTLLYRVYQNDWCGLEVDYIHKYGEDTYKYYE
jgi:hypothetical protein